jgi:hypothetical protein
MCTQADLAAARQEMDSLRTQLGAARYNATSGAEGFRAQLDAAAAAAERDAASIAGLESRLEDTQRQLAAERARSAEQVRFCGPNVAVDTSKTVVLTHDTMRSGCSCAGSAADEWRSGSRVSNAAAGSRCSRARMPEGAAGAVLGRYISAAAVPAGC